MEEIDLYDLLRFYAKKWLTIATFVMLGGIVGVAYTYFVQSPEYTSKAQLLLVGNTRSSASDSVVLNNYVQLFTSHRVLGSVTDEQDYAKGYDALAASTTAENVKNTDIINVAISTSDAKQSRVLLESAIESFRKEAKTLYGDNNIKISVVDGASQPERPANIRPVMQIGLALAAAFAAAIISLFFVYDYRSSRRGKGNSPKSVEAPAGARLDTPRAEASIESKLDALEPTGQEIVFGVSTEEYVEQVEAVEVPATDAPKPAKKRKPRKTTTKTSTKKSTK